MKISSKSSYALHTLVYLAQNRQKDVISIAEVGNAEKIPVKFLEQILLSLKAGGLVKSRRGAKGGYFLAMEPQRISLEEVLRLMDDMILAPARGQSDDSSGSGDPVDQVWSDINDIIFDRLSSITLRDVLKRIEATQNRDALNFAI